jgi:hypothetical protein
MTKRCSRMCPDFEAPGSPLPMKTRMYPAAFFWRACLWFSHRHSREQKNCFWPVLTYRVTSAPQVAHSRVCLASGLRFRLPIEIDCERKSDVQ